MCFDENIWPHLAPGGKYHLDGEISFGYGNTYLCIRNAFHPFGNNVTEDMEGDLEGKEEEKSLKELWESLRENRPPKEEGLPF